MRSLKARWLAISIGLAVVFLAAYFGIGAYMAETLTTPKRTRPPAQVETLSAQERVTVTARDGLQLAGTFVPRPDSRRALIMLHGLNQCRQCDFKGQFPSLAGQINRAGYNVLLIDLRGHGESPDSRLTFGDVEKRDVLGALDWLHQRGITQVDVLGVSYGAVVTVRTGLEPDGAAGISGMILDSCFGDFGEVLERNFTQDTGYPSFLLPGGLLLTRARFGVDMAKIRPIDELGRIKAPVFMIYGGRDRFVTAAQQQAMAAAKPDAEVWTVAEANHTAIQALYPEEYLYRVLSFLKRTMN
jgi:pimeloyl-ACP methyl ester carboxylesterase